MSLFCVSSDIQPTIYIQAADSDKALLSFREGFDNRTYKKYVDHPSFKIEEIKTLEELLKDAPQEFRFEGDTSF